MASLAKSLHVRRLRSRAAGPVLVLALAACSVALWPALSAEGAFAAPGRAATKPPAAAAAVGAAKSAAKTTAAKPAASKAEGAKATKTPKVASAAKAAVAAAAVAVAAGAAAKAAKAAKPVKAAKAAKPAGAAEEGVAGPKAPKRPLNAYMLFATKERPALAKKQESVTAVAKALGDAWKALADKAKAKWGEAATEEKNRYEKELQAFLAGGGVLPTRGHKAGAEPKAPRAPSAYNLFIKARLPLEKAKPANKDAKVTVIIKTVAEQWKSLPDKERKTFEESAAKAKLALAK